MIVSMYIYNNASSHTYIDVPISQFVNRPFTSEMDIISHHILHTAKQHYGAEDDIDVRIRLPNHMTQLSFYPKRMKDDMQLDYHCDCTWGTDGTWIPHINTQEINTPTYSITIGDSRELIMKEWKAGIGKEGARSNLPEKRFTLEHGM